MLQFQNQYDEVSSVRTGSSGVYKGESRDKSTAVASLLYSTQVQCQHTKGTELELQCHICHHVSFHLPPSLQDALTGSSLWANITSAVPKPSIGPQHLEPLQKASFHFCSNNIHTILSSSAGHCGSYKQNQSHPRPVHEKIVFHETDSLVPKSLETTAIHNWIDAQL